MSRFFSFLTSLFFFFNPSPSAPPALPSPPFPSPIIFQSYPPSNISVNWGASAPDHTIFMVSDLLPGDSEFREITASNSGSLPRPLSIRGTKTSEEKNFSQILSLTIFKDGSPVYGPTLLAHFFTDSATASGVTLGPLAGHSTSTYKFLVEFPSSAGNEYQLARVVFDLKIGKLLFLPRPCPCTCYRSRDGQRPIGPADLTVYAGLDEGDRVVCPNRFSCAAISPPQ